MKVHHGDPTDRPCYQVDHLWDPKFHCVAKSNEKLKRVETCITNLEKNPIEAYH